MDRANRVTHLLAGYDALWPRRLVPRTGPASATLTEALHALGTDGYVRAFELIDGNLTCASCATAFAPGEFVVEGTIDVADREGRPATLYALRSPRTGMAGTWLVADPSVFDAALRRGLRTAELMAS